MSTLKRKLDKARTWLFAGIARQQDIDILYRQVEGLFQISRAMEGKLCLRQLRGWAISPDTISWILTALQEYNQPSVVEFGSGQSTLILASALRHRGGHLISIEHDPDYAAKIERQIQACGLVEQVTLIVVPIIDHAPNEKSYDLGSIVERQIDVALVDGPPPDLCGEAARLIPLQWALKHLSPYGKLFLDDTTRRAEQACLAQLQTLFPTIEISELQTEKGLTVISWPAQACRP